MMHYGFCRKHADQTGEGGCPECAMDHQQATISAMTETAKESSRVHIEMHNQITALQAEVARLKDVPRQILETLNGNENGRVIDGELWIRFGEAGAAVTPYMKREPKP